MLNSFIEFIEDRALFYPESKLLVAVSGGPDSVCLVHLLHRAGFQFEMAHMNFGLRGSESDADEAFVKTLGKTLAVPTHIRNAIIEPDENIQEQARNLRYAWFKALQAQHDFDYIVTAHHLDDAVETMLFNMTRGGGIDGLAGIPVKNGSVVRPFMFTHKQAILDWLAEHQIEFRIDASNLTDAYTRNKIRNQLIPAWEHIQPCALNSLRHTVQRLQTVQRVYRQAIMRMRNELIHVDSALGMHKISMLEIIGRQVDAEMLYELLREFDFTYATVAQIYDAIGGQPGARFYSATHELIADRGFFLIRERMLTPSNADANTEVDLDDLLAGKIAGWRASLEDAAEIALKQPSTIALMDLSALSFPLIRRKWKPGDAFKPLGLKGVKKISDFLVDLKIDQFEKEQVWVWESAGTIVWVEGFRISELVKVTPSTHHVLKVFPI